MSSPASWEAEFLFALRNRTGKYFIGRDLLEDQSQRIAKVRYGRVSAARVPGGAAARALAIAAEREISLRIKYPGLPGRIRRRRPVLHLDPITVPLYEVGPRDAVLCHDLGPVTHPDLFGQNVERLYRAIYERMVQTGPKMVFVSRASRNAFVSEYGALADMRVIYPPLRAEITASAPEPVPGISAPFLLTVGSIGRRKNQKRCIQAFARSGLGQEGWQYVLCGSREPGSEDVLQLAEQTAGVHVLPYVSDGALVWLFEHAGGFVLASNLEGFGVPVIEAIAAGLVPIVSGDSVLEEVAGEGALSVDPTDTDDIAQKMKNLAQMDASRKARHVALLSASIERFTPEAFRDGWRTVLGA